MTLMQIFEGTYLTQYVRWYGIKNLVRNMEKLVLIIMLEEKINNLRANKVGK